MGLLFPLVNGVDLSGKDAIKSWIFIENGDLSRALPVVYVVTFSLDLIVYMDVKQWIPLIVKIVFDLSIIFVNWTGGQAGQALNGGKSGGNPGSAPGSRKSAGCHRNLWWV